jgi:ribonuclease HI
LPVALATELWSDGACSGNPGPGGWAFILIARRPDGTVAKKLECRGGEKMTTNNRMELKAALEGLLALTRPTTLMIHTDSAYLANAFTEGWLGKWQSNGLGSGIQQPTDGPGWGSCSSSFASTSRGSIRSAPSTRERQRPRT